MMNRKGYLLAVMLLGLFHASGAMANTLEEITYSILSGERTRIVLTTSEAAPQPSSFATDNPARIAIDIPGTRNGVKQRTTNIGSGVVRSVTAIEGKGRTRVVVNLTHSVPYDVSVDGRQIVVSVTPGGESVAAKQPSAPVTAAAQPTKAAITNVDFRRGGKDVSRVEISLSDPDTVVDMRQEGTKVVLDFLDTSVLPSQIRTLDVTDFATPVQTISTKPYRGGARMVITTKGVFEHSGYQVNNVYTVEFRSVTKKEKEARKKRELVYVGEKLSLDFQDIPVRSVLQLLADFTNKNIVVSDTVNGSITLRLKNVPWDQAMDIILKTKGLSKRENGNVILVAPTKEITARERLDLESKKQVAELAPLHSELIQINYAKAADLADLLKSEENRLLSGRGNVSVDTRTNTLLIQDTAMKLDEIRALIEKLDVPVRQVQIESRVVIANDDFIRDIGVRFGFNTGDLDGDNIWTIGGGQPGHLGNTNGVAPGIENPAGSGMEALMVNLPKTLGSTRGGGINFLVADIGSYLLQLELTAMQQEGKGEIISSPRVITSDQTEAIIKQGIEIPYQQATGQGNTNVAFKEAVLQLKVTPHITPDDRIMMDLTVTKDEADFARSVLGVPPLNTREVKTSVLVDNGETVVLGGVFEREKTDSEEKIPFFGDLPIIGYAFKETLTSDRKRELLIFVTPKILKESLTVR